MSHNSNQSLNKISFDTLFSLNKLQNPSKDADTLFFKGNKNSFEDDFTKKLTAFTDSSDEECLSILQKDQINDINQQILFRGPVNDQKKDNNKKENKCSCTKSKCLRLNCSCFKNQGFCSPECGCQNCLNSEKYQEVRNFVLEKTKFISRASFQEKTVVVKDKVISKRGCKCDKGCQKLYCSCYKNGAKCSSICKCINCHNDKLFLDREEALEVYDYLPRKKFKISIDFQEQKEKSKNGQMVYSVSFKNYQDTHKINQTAQQTVTNSIESVQLKFFYMPFSNKNKLQQILFYKFVFQKFFLFNLIQFINFYLINFLCFVKRQSIYQFLNYIEKFMRLIEIELKFFMLFLKITLSLISKINNKLHLVTNKILNNILDVVFYLFR